MHEDEGFKLQPYEFITHGRERERERGGGVCRPARESTAVSKIFRKIKFVKSLHLNPSSMLCDDSSNLFTILFHCHADK